MQEGDTELETEGETCRHYRHCSPSTRSKGMAGNKAATAAIAGAAAVSIAAYLIARKRRTTSKLPGKTEAWLSDPSKHLGGQQHHPSAMRNRIPILKTLLRLLHNGEISGPALEIATGTGALMEVVAPAFPNLLYLPSEVRTAHTWDNHQ